MFLVILIGAIRKIYTVHYSQYLLASMISAGLILFNSHEVHKLELENVFGIFLVIGSLFFDGLTSS